MGIDVKEGAPHVLGEGEVLLPFARVEVVIEDAADAARLVAVRQEEILVAPFPELLIVGHLVGVAGALHGGMEIDRVGVVLHPQAVQHRGEVSAAAEPCLGGHDEAGVHVDSWNEGVPGVDDQRDAGGPEARVFLGPGNLAPELRREFAVHG